jgi:hypothetical protein
MFIAHTINLVWYVQMLKITFGKTIFGIITTFNPSEKQMFSAHTKSQMLFVQIPMLFVQMLQVTFCLYIAENIAY